MCERLSEYSKVTQPENIDYFPFPFRQFGRDARDMVACFMTEPTFPIANPNKLLITALTSLPGRPLSLRDTRSELQYSPNFIQGVADETIPEEKKDEVDLFMRSVSAKFLLLRMYRRIRQLQINPQDILGDNFKQAEELAEMLTALETKYDSTELIIMQNADENEKTKLLIRTGKIKPLPRHIHLFIPEALTLLTNDQRKLFEMAYFQKLSGREIAQQTGRSFGQIESQLSRARAIYNSFLARFGFKELSSYPLYIQKAVRKEKRYEGVQIIKTWYTTDEALKDYQSNEQQEQQTENEIERKYPLFVRLKGQTKTRKEIIKEMGVTESFYKSLLHRAIEKGDVKAGVRNDIEALRNSERVRQVVPMIKALIEHGLSYEAVLWQSKQPQDIVNAAISLLRKEKQIPKRIRRH